MDFRDLPKSLQDKLTSGEPWVAEPHEADALYAYLNQHLPGDPPRRVAMRDLKPLRYPHPYNGPPLHFNCRSSLYHIEGAHLPSFLGRAVESIASKLRRDMREAVREQLDAATEARLPAGRASTPVAWDALEGVLGAEALRRIRETT